MSTEKENGGLDGSVDVCRLTCGPYGSLWPRPTVKTAIGWKIDYNINDLYIDL